MRLVPRTVTHRIPIDAFGNPIVTASTISADPIDNSVTPAGGVTNPPANSNSGAAASPSNDTSSGSNGSKGPYSAKKPSVGGDLPAPNNGDAADTGKGTGKSESDLTIGSPAGSSSNESAEPEKPKKITTGSDD
jgi:hypothetical protein